MSIRIMSMVWEAANNFLTSNEKTVLLRLADFAADDGSSIYPSWNRVARDLGISRSTVARVFLSLQKKGVLIKIEEAIKSEWKSCRYRINKRLLESWKEPDDDIDDPWCQGDTTLVSERDYPSVTVTRGASVRLTPEPSFNNHHSNHHKKGSNVVAFPPAQKISSKVKGEKLDPEIILSSEWREVAVDWKVHPDWIELRWEEFKAYWTTGEGKNKRKLDWLATWRNNCKSAGSKFMYAPPITEESQQEIDAQRAERNRQIREENARIEKLYRGEEQGDEIWEGNRVFYE